MVEPLLSGIILGLVPATIGGLFVAAWLQFRRSDQILLLTRGFEKGIDRENEPVLGRRPLDSFFCFVFLLFLAFFFLLGKTGKEKGGED